MGVDGSAGVRYTGGVTGRLNTVSPYDDCIIRTAERQPMSQQYIISPPPGSRLHTIGRIGKQIAALANKPRVTRADKQRLAYLRREKTAHERGNRMPLYKHTASHYSERYAYIVTLDLQNTASGVMFTRDVTVLSMRRLSLAAVKQHARAMVDTHMPSATFRGVTVEMALSS